MTALDIAFTGDLVLDEPEPGHWLGGIAPLTRGADITIGHLEVPHTTRGTELKSDVPAPGADPAHLAALARAGFDAVTLAGNHGLQGIIGAQIIGGNISLETPRQLQREEYAHGTVRSCNNRISSASGRFLARLYRPY